MKLAAKYTAFALVAMALNLLAQELVVQLYNGAYALYLSIAAGTAAGLVSKYWLDKHYIFAVSTLSRRDDFNTFFTYGLTGIVTTLIFWSFELAFDTLFATKFARYAGACTGLAIGYVIKYRLDKRFVFAE